MGEVKAAGTCVILRADIIQHHQHRMKVRGEHRPMRTSTFTTKQ